MARRRPPPSVVSGASVTVELWNVNTNYQVDLFSGMTDSNGVFRIGYVMNLPDGAYLAAVTQLSHATYEWNKGMDGPDDSNGGGDLDESHGIPH